MEKCYKLHGYPNKSQGRGRGGHHQAVTQTPTKRVYNTWTDQDSQDSQGESTGTMPPGLNAEQTKQLFQFLSNLTASNQQKSNEQDASIANMAGINPLIMTTAYNFNAVCCTCKLGNDVWIIDSGASDHMSFDSKALYDLKPLTKSISVSLPNGYKV